MQIRITPRYVVVLVLLLAAIPAIAPPSQFFRILGAEIAGSFAKKNEPVLITVTINDMGDVSRELTLPVTVEALLSAKGKELGPHDLMTLSPKSPLSDNDFVLILRPTRVVLKDAGKKQEIITFSETVEDLLKEQLIVLDEFDTLEPLPGVPLKEDMMIEITRIEKKEITRTRDILYETATRENPNVKYGILQTIQEGENGRIKERILVTKRNGKIVGEKVLEDTVTKEPITKVVEKGTKIEIGRIQEGGASWYRFKGGLFAASTTFRRGTYVRVTSLENDGAIIVRINDYGPLIPGRVIDLDAVAFKLLAPLTRGVIHVRVEEIL